MLHYWRPHTKLVQKRIESVDEDGNVVTHEFESVETRFFTPSGGGMQVESTYGGKLTENVVQAISRDVLGDALRRLDKHPLYNSIILHVHDSLALEVPEGQGDVDEVCRQMALTPEWAPGLPIAVEGYRGRHFKG